jgi:lipopolysaccharide/colanic/teichoic acid biosynthesis glycosyltransferase
MTESKVKEVKSNKGIYRRFLKRPMDFILSLMAIIVLSPVLIIVGVLVRFKLGSPVLFKQKRPGLNEKIFTMYKFRTMTDEKDENGEPLPDSVRLTKFGRMLRSTSLDELPELFNILKGDMSIVGPRPLLIRYLPYYFDHERQRSNVRPGITGLAQVNGRNALTWNERFAIDVEYVKQLTFLNDFKIIVRTVLVVFQKKDILVGDEHVLLDLDVERSGVVSSGEK